MNACTLLTVTSLEPDRVPWERLTMQLDAKLVSLIPVLSWTQRSLFSPEADAKICDGRAIMSQSGDPRLTMRTQHGASMENRKLYTGSQEQKKRRGVFNVQEHAEKQQRSQETCFLRH